MCDIVISEKLAPNCLVQIYDEAQDMTTQLYELLNLWSKSADRVVLAGDHLQTIYVYAGASPEYFTGFTGDLEVIPLSRRLTRNIWAIASDVISTHTPYETPCIKTKDEDGGLITLDHSNLNGWLNSNHKNPNSSVFHLVRTSYAGYDVAKTLYSLGIPFGGLQEYAWRESEMHLYNAINSIRIFRPVNLKEFCALVDAYPEKYFGCGAQKSEVKDKIRRGTMVPDMAFITRGLIESIMFDDPLRLANIGELTKKKINGAIDKRIVKITQDDLDKTQILTIHGSKGLEADTVFLHTAYPRCG
jgi:superfamily I DNA/RNA helicase